MLIDSHAHLDAPRFDADREAVVMRAHQAGIEAIITCGADLASSRAAIDLGRRYEGVCATAGVHPHEASSVCSQASGEWVVSPDALAELRELLSQPGVVALGEIGLDYHHDLAPRAAQRAAFASQLRLAAEAGLPVVVHCREAEEDLMAIMEDAPKGLAGVLHCFLGSERLAQWALARGLHLGIAGPITFARMEALAKIVQAAPPERLLVETDCPYLAPHPLRGKRNEPAYVVHVARRLAELRDLPFEQVAAVTTANARELFHVG
jgi:TatD DNase family protein